MVLLDFCYPEGVHFDCVTQLEDQDTEDLLSEVDNLQGVLGVGKGP